MALQTLVGKEPELTLLTVERGTVVDHLGVDFHLQKGKIIVYLTNIEHLIISGSYGPGICVLQRSKRGK